MFLWRTSDIINATWLQQVILAQTYKNKPHPSIEHIRICLEGEEHAGCNTTKMTCYTFCLTYEALCI